MTQEKMTKLVTASVVAATLLLVFLLGFLIFQWITMGVQENRKQYWLSENERMQEIIDSGEKDLHYYHSEVGKEHLLYLWQLNQEGNK